MYWFAFIILAIKNRYTQPRTLTIANNIYSHFIADMLAVLFVK